MKLCSICNSDDYFIVASSSGGGFFFENREGGSKHYCEWCFEIAHGGEGLFMIKPIKGEDRYLQLNKQDQGNAQDVENQNEYILVPPYE